MGCWGTLADSAVHSLLQFCLALWLFAGSKDMLIKCLLACSMPGREGLVKKAFCINKGLTSKEFRDVACSYNSKRIAGCIISYCILSSVQLMLHKDPAYCLNPQLILLCGLCNV